MKITDTVFRDYLTCKLKAFLVLQGEAGTPREYSVVLDEVQQEYRALAAAATLKKANLESVAVQQASIASGSILVLHCRIVCDSFEFHFDALRRAAGKSRLGNFHYEPILFLKENAIAEDRKRLLAFGGIVLGEVQGVQPSRGGVVHGKECLLTNVGLRSWLDKSQEAINDLLQMQHPDAQPTLSLIKHCDLCQFRDRCKSEAVAKDDLSLLRGIKPKEIATFASKGIFSVNQLSYTFRVRRRPKHLQDRSNPYYHALRALALREKKVHILTRPTIPPATTCVYLDMEGDMNARSVYLIGALVVANGISAFHSYWADQPSEEGVLFDNLRELLVGLDDARVFHFGSYESTALKRMSSAGHKKAFTQLLKERSTDTLKAVYGNVYFPTYSNGLKDIGHFLGCQWSEPDASGTQCVVWRKRWEWTRQPAFKEKIVQYNREDCDALRQLTEYLAAMEKSNEPSRDGFTLVDDLLDHADYGRWGQRKFAVDAFESMADHAYFDYQRSKIYIRSQPELKRIHRHKQKRKEVANKPNRIVVCGARKCWRCKSSELVRDTTRWHRKRQLDLRISSTTGIRRWITEFQTPFHRCSNCKTPVVPRSYKRESRWGRSLIAWCVYQHVVNKIPFEGLEMTLRECFGIKVPYPQIHRFKRIAVKYYNRTYSQILKRLVAAQVLHGDETKAKLRGETGYVWVFTNMLDVAYMYKPTRKGEFLHDLLRDFKGVLVSDFYSAYDSLACPQQKCLIHLMWDINGDLLKNPFDEDLKSIASQFGELLRTIIATVDRFGLKARWLKKHQKDVAAFYRMVEKREMCSAVSQHYQERMVKCREKLFTFLDHDGVPWNNNNAEHAIKPYAKYRRIAKRSMTRSGIMDYLVLLSIYQTCEYRGVSFLEFLLSGERDIEEFCRKVW